MPDPEKVAEALKMCRAELIILQPRLTEPFASHVKSCVDAANEALEDRDDGKTD